MKPTKTTTVVKDVLCCCQESVQDSTNIIINEGKSKCRDHHDDKPNEVSDRLEHYP
jgi:hypothetical protein